MGVDTHTDENHRISYGRFPDTFRNSRRGAWRRVRAEGTPLESYGTVFAISLTEPRVTW